MEIEYNLYKLALKIDSLDDDIHNNFIIIHQTLILKLKKDNTILNYASIFSIFILVVFLISFFMVDHISRVFAHSFVTDYSSYLLGLDKQVPVELELAKKNYPSNITLSMDHSDNAVTLLNKIYSVEDNIVEDNDLVKRYNKVTNSSNSTTYALVVADLLDATLRQYADAIVTEIDLTNRSNLGLLDNMKNFTTSPSSESSSSINFTKFFSNNNPIFNYADYETAKALLVEIKGIFQSNLKTSNNVKNQSVDIISKLEKDLEKLSDLINNNGSPA